MVRPHHFHPNPQTAADNSFQSQAEQASNELLAAQARDEVTAAAASLQAAGVTVHLFEDFGAYDTPDSVFPNNCSPPTRAGMWRSTRCTRPTAAASGAVT